MSAHDWHHRAACKGERTILFFVNDPEAQDEAKAVCRRCPVQQRCLDTAMARGERHGIWGGMNPEERQRLKRRQARAAVA